MFFGKGENTFNLIIRLFGFIPGHRKNNLIILLIFMIFSAFFEVITISSVVPFLTLLLNPSELFKITALVNLMELLQIDFSKADLYITLLFSISTLSSGILKLLTLWLTNRLSAEIGTDFSKICLRNTIYQEYQFHIDKSNSETLSSLTYHLDEAITVIYSALSTITNMVLGLSIVLTLIFVSFRITLISFVILIIFYVFISLITSKRIKIFSKFIETKINKQYLLVQEIFLTIKDIIIDKKEDYFVRKYLEQDYTKRIKISNINFLSSFPRYALEMIIILTFIIVGFSLRNSQINTNSILTYLGVFALGSQKLLPSFQSIYSNISQIRARSANIKTILDYLERKPILSSIPKEEKNLDFSNLYLKEVGFNYPSSRYILTDLNLKINKGDRIGIIGTSGSGKSTLIDILLGLLKPTKGYFIINSQIIYENGKVNKKIINDWRKLISHVPQNIYITNNTVFENIAFGIEKKKIDIKKVKYAAEQAKISSYIESMPEKYNTIFGEGGSKLSGGQKQRIGIARALYKSPQILVLDEATSALDKKTESNVIDSLEDLPTSLTIIFISHRESSLKLCNKIYDLDKKFLKIL